MASSYTELQQYRNCPRKFGFAKLGYQAPVINGPLTTGQLVHTGIAAHFRGQNVRAEVTLAAKNDRLVLKERNLDNGYEQEKKLVYAGNRALELLHRYIPAWSKDFKATLIEPVLELDGVVCHPDLIAFYKEQRVIVDYKTSYHPDDRWYDISNQCDLYAYISSQLEIKGHPDCSRISLVIYDIISEEGIYRHMRPPRLQAGADLFAWIQALNEKVEDNAEWFIDEPHPDYTCPSRCDFFGACFILETDTWKSCQDFLDANFQREE